MNFKVNMDDKHLEMSTEASLEQLLTCVTLVVKNFYDNLSDDKTKELFREGFAQMAKDELPFLTDEERKEKTKEMISELINRKVHKSLGELLEMLKGLCEND